MTQRITGYEIVAGSYNGEARFMQFTEEQKVELAALFKKNQDRAFFLDQVSPEFQAVLLDKLLTNLLVRVSPVWVDDTKDLAGDAPIAIDL